MANKKIISITFEDGSYFSIENFKTRQQLIDENPERNNYWEYYKQFREIEDEMLDSIEEERIVNYAEIFLNMVKEDGIEQKEIEDFTDIEIIDEAIFRNIFLCERRNIITQDLHDRFTNVLNVAESIEIDDMISYFEAKYKIK